MRKTGEEREGAKSVGESTTMIDKPTTRTRGRPRDRQGRMQVADGQGLELYKS